MVKDLEIVTFDIPWSVVLRDKYSGQVFVTLTEGFPPRVNSPQLISNDEFDHYQLLLSDTFRLFKKGPRTV